MTGRQVIRRSCDARVMHAAIDISRCSRRMPLARSCGAVIVAPGFASVAATAHDFLSSRCSHDASASALLLAYARYAARLRTRSALIGSLETPLAPAWVWLAVGEDPASQYGRRGLIRPGRNSRRHLCLREIQRSARACGAGGGLTLVILGDSCGAFRLRRFHARRARSRARAGHLRIGRRRRVGAGCLNIDAFARCAILACSTSTRGGRMRPVRSHAELPHTVRFLARARPLIDHALDVTRTERCAF